MVDSISDGFELWLSLRYSRGLELRRQNQFGKTWMIQGAGDPTVRLAFIFIPSHA